MKLSEEKKKRIKELAKQYNVSKEEMLDAVINNGLKYMERRLVKIKLDETDMKDLDLPQRIVDALYADYNFTVRSVSNLNLEQVPGIGPASARIIKERIEKLYEEHK